TTARYLFRSTPGSPSTLVLAGVWTPSVEGTQMEVLRVEGDSTESNPRRVMVNFPALAETADTSAQPYTASGMTLGTAPTSAIRFGLSFGQSDAGPFGGYLRTYLENCYFLS